MRKIDTHQHFWNYSKEEYGWIGRGMETLQQDFLPHDLKPLLEKETIDGTIAVQARQSLKETEWLLQLAEDNPFILGVVGWVDLCSPHVDEQLEKYAQNKKLKGIRHVLHDEPDDCYILGDAFLHGLSRLKHYGLTYDLLIRPQHLQVCIKAVEKLPEQLFIIDHIAKPLIKEKIMDPWATDIQAIAEYPNVYCKLSGMVTEADWGDWDESDFNPYIDIIFNAFGSNRITIGSDWPVCTLAASYDEVIGIACDYLQRLSDDERKEVWELNPEQFYGV